ncbi:hypothetical protein BCPG_05036 [Burkholderia cenocepacia PC184]|nr:hypothetical protein BCPG_05036 [Burkholderia cenocepacia PC184]
MHVLPRGRLPGAHCQSREGRPPRIAPRSQPSMTTRFKLGDHVRWNSEAGYVTGTIIAIHTADFDYKGHRHRASPDDPQYEIKSDRTDHVAAHRGRVLERIAGKDGA